MSPPVDMESVLDELLDGVFVCSEEGEIIYSNPAFARTLGYTHEAIATKNVVKDLVERKLEWRAMLSLLEQGGTIYDYEMKFRKEDATVAYITLSAVQFRRDGLVGVAGVMRDITTRKGVETDLREKSYRTDVMNKIAKIASTDAEMHHASLAAMGEELRKLISLDQITVGLSEDNGRHVELISALNDQKHGPRSLGSVVYDGSIVEKLKLSGSPLVVDRDAARLQFSELALLERTNINSLLAVPLVSRGRVIGSLNIGHSKDGVYDADSAESLRMVADQIAGLIDNMMLLDSLGRKIKLQESLVRSGVEILKAASTGQIYSSIAAGIREVVPYVDLSFYVVDWPNRLIRPMFAVGTYVDEVLANPGTLDEGVVGSVARTGRAEFMDDVDSDPRVADVPGVPKEHQSMLAMPLMGNEGVLGVLELYRPRGQVFTNADLDAGRLFAQQASAALQNWNLVSKLQEAKKEIEMLNDLMFHDISNFNFACLSYMEEVAAEKDLHPQNRTRIEKSLQLIRQTTGLIENVKKLTKIGAMNPREFVPVDLADTMRKVASELQTSFPEKTVSVKMAVPEDCRVLGNSLVEELFLNLLQNSAKYDPHDEVEIDVESTRAVEDGRQVWKVCVADRGYGIPDEKKSLLFQRHTRLRSDSKISGSGMGLSICKALTDKFGGRIWVEDRVPGRNELGARFCIVLPAARADNA